MSTKHANEMLKACAPKAVRFRVRVKRAYLVYTTHSVCESISSVRKRSTLPSNETLPSASEYRLRL